MFKGLKEDIVKAVKEAIKPKESFSVQLIRQQLSSIDLSGVRDLRPLTEEDRKVYNGRVAAFYPDIERDLKKFLIAQEEYIARVADNEKQLMFARGTINGIMLILEHYQQVFEEYKAQVKPEEPFDKNKLFPKV